MKAVVFESYGQPDVLKIKEIEKPEVSDDGVLVRVHASSINVAEWYGMTGLPIARILGGGLVKPKDTRLGADFAGVVEVVGKNITDFKRGDEVFGGRSGAYAEYVSVKNAIALKPVNVTMEEAASVPTAGITALQGLRDHGKLQPGQKVLINGASGGVGTFAIQIAKAFGAEVTAVCSTQNVEHARALGADHVIDYTKEDFTRNGQKYDVLFNVNGGRSWSDYKRALKPNATFVLVGGPKTGVIGPVSLLVKTKIAMLGASQKFVFFTAKFNRADMEVLKEFIESGKVKPFVEKSYPMTRIADAMTYLGNGHAKGKIVVTMG
ncbi:MAG TPA: NAD(P)-dependent alcohol dehydrogenase [Anaerolineales bacterium]|nr:NAD(P)-dependent alcohol dehydrogenase [Anaerolineales bacterium]HNQ94126.1 NAD(P)-dependent alcohol dehydrogenase [Anaerolineales bacterium]HNS61489.1 NAD(P)-dependent alcohol dehydrogenase [Anaerolineales bacterium]